MPDDYQRLDGPQPSHPPSYDDIDDDLNLRNAQPIDIQQFEIDDGFDDDAHRHGRGTAFLTRATLITKKFASNINSSIIHPVSQMIDPIYEGYKYFSSIYESTILKLGNPLVVKRLLYVSFIISIICLVTRYSNDASIGHPSGGGFAGGMFYDREKISNSILSMIDINLMKENLEYFSSIPHIAGTKGDFTLAKYMEKYMKNNGLNVMDVNAVEVNLNYPNVDMGQTYVKLEDGSYVATLRELGQDSGMENLAYNPNSLNTNGEIRGVYYYANYGTPEDIKRLKDSGVNLEGSILLIKYGGEGDTIPESNKVRLANIEKVQAVIFISESFKDANGNTHEDIIQKFNVGLERYCTGDVLTPGWSLGDGYVARLPWFKSEATPKIPTIPISYRDGKELVKRLNKGGVKFNDGWYSGDSNKRSGILLKISNIEKQAQLIWNIVASIEGREQSEKGIIIGAPRDSTCFGTASSNTGTVALLELIKIFAALQRKYNWVPARTIMFASFDGSEYNLAGLTEWVEKSKDALTKGVYTYIDISDLVSGDQLNINSHPLLQGLIHDVLKKVNNQDNKNFYDIYKDQNSGKDDIFYNLVELKNYIPFISLLNIPSLEIKFKSSSPSFPINSCFDNFENFEAFKFDPEMTKLKQIVEILARVCFELVEAPILPLNFGDFGNSLTKYVVQLEHTINTQISKVSQPNKPVVHFDKIKFAISKFLIGAKRLGDWKANWKQFISESGDVEPTFLALNRWKQNEMFIEFNHKFLAKDVKHERPGYLNLLFGVPFLGTQRDIGHNKELNIFPNVFDYLEVEDFGRAQYVIDYIAELIDHSAEDMLRM